MTVFTDVLAQKNHFDLYIQWFEFIEGSAIFKAPYVKHHGVNKITSLLLQCQQINQNHV